MWMFPMFEDPVKTRERAVRRAQRALEHKVPWPEVKPVRYDRVSDDVGVVASTYVVHNPLAEIFPDVGADGIVDPSGTLRYTTKPLPLYSGLIIGSSPADYGGDSKLYFDADMLLPTLHYLRNATDTWHPWMGLTPLEMWSQRSGIMAAQGDVILGGLGMGWLLSQIAAKRTVKSIVVVEKDKNLLDWFGTKLCEGIPKVKAVVHSGVFEYADSRRDDYASLRFILDIWPDLGDAKWDRRLKRLRALGATCWAWGSPRGSADDYRYRREEPYPY